MTAPFKSPRSAAPALTPEDQLYWPFGCLSLYSQMLRDIGSYAQTLTRCTDVMEAMQAEGMLSLRLMDDLMRAYGDLALLPWTALVGALGQTAGIGPSTGAPTSPSAQERGALGQERTDLGGVGRRPHEGMQHDRHGRDGHGHHQQAQ